MDSKERYYEDRINILESELQVAMDSAMKEQS